MVLKITPKQRAKINALVRKFCCNCYKGNCLLLDDGEETKCGSSFLGTVFTATIF